MFNKQLIGKNIAEAEEILKALGVTKIDVIRNDTKWEYQTDIDLVVKAEVEGTHAVLTVSKFLLKV